MPPGSARCCTRTNKQRRSRWWIILVTAVRMRWSSWVLVASFFKNTMYLGKILSVAIFSPMLKGPLGHLSLLRWSIGPSEWANWADAENESATVIFSYHLIHFITIVFRLVCILKQIFVVCFLLKDLTKSWERVNIQKHWWTKIVKLVTCMVTIDRVKAAISTL